MERPYIICHMTMSIDGKVTGHFLNELACSQACDIYYDINRDFKSNGFICGRVTMESSFTNRWYPDLSKYQSINDKNDYIRNNLNGFYAIAFDTKGKLGWKSNVIIDDDPGYSGAQIIEVLTKHVDGRYLKYLQDMNISYIFAGDLEIDVSLALYKLKHLFQCETLLLEGGSIINGSFLKANVIDELSLVIAPVVGHSDDKSLFNDSTYSEYELSRIDSRKGNIILNYIKK